jgi:hypothetical protein
LASPGSDDSSGADRSGGTRRRLVDLAADPAGASDRFKQEHGNALQIVLQPSTGGSVILQVREAPGSYLVRPLPASTESGGMVMDALDGGTLADAESPRKGLDA